MGPQHYVPPETYTGEYLALVGVMLLAAIICGAMVTLSYVLGPKKITPYKASPYECGVAPVGDAKERFPIKFYLVAIVFILFDIEVVFLWGWMTAFQKYGSAFLAFSFWEFIVYMATFVVGYAYIIRVGAIDWDETMALHMTPESLKAGERPVPRKHREPSPAAIDGSAN